MDRSNEVLRDYLTLDEFLQQFSYVKRVVKSCQNDLQLESAKRWAEDWSNRMRRNIPSVVKSSNDLYLSVINDK